MINHKDARRIALEFLRKTSATTDSAIFSIVDSATREETFGWVFLFNDKRYLETGDSRYALCGQQPIVVLHNTGRALYLPPLPYEPTEDVEANVRWFFANRDIDKRINAFVATLDEESV